LFYIEQTKRPEQYDIRATNEEGTIQTETIKMVDIASNYHIQLQEKLQMNMARRRAINKMKNM